METKINIDGFIYRAEAETVGCEGCAFQQDTGEFNCNSAFAHSGRDCIDSEIIWIKDSVKTASGTMSKQVGGSHYQKKIQPWDIIAEWNLDYWRGNVIKYVLRAPEKNGVEDIKKAIHYLEYIVENYVKDRK